MNNIRKIYLDIIFTTSFIILLSFCGSVLAQSMTMQEVRTNLLANPPVYGDSAIRKACFDALDIKFKEPDAATDDDIREFYDNMINHIATDIALPSSGLAVVYKMYNHGFIVKMQDLTVAFDLIKGMPSWKYIPGQILNELDVVMVSHEHGDHYDPAILSTIKQYYHGIIIIPEEMDFSGAIELSPGDSVVIEGVVFKAHDALHGDTPCRIFEVYSPTGVKILHTGDNQTSVTLPDVEDIDILLLNSWVNEGSGELSNVVGMYNCLQKLTPQLMIPGHCNELNHDPWQRWAYDSVYALMELDIPSDIVVMAWGEKMVYRPNSVLPIYNTTSVPVIDGYWDTAWAFTPLIQMPKILLETPADWFDLNGTFRAMWDSDNLYFYVSVQDDILRTDNADMGNNDVVELFFDGDNSKNDAGLGYDENDIQMRFEYMGGSWQAPNSEFVYQQTDRGYNLEIRIPDSDLTFNPISDLIVGFDAQVTDNDNGTKNSIIRWWSESMDNWFNPSLFGTANLIGSSLTGIKNVYYTPGSIQIDAAIDNAWIGQELHAVNHVISGAEFIYTPNDVDLLWNIMWNINYLYFWFEVTDDTLVNDSGNDYYQDDCIEIWLDGDNSKNPVHDGINDYLFQFRYHPASIIEAVKQPIGPPLDLNEIIQAAQLTNQGFILEVAIPLEMLGITPYDSVFFGFDIDYNDDDNSGERDTKLKTYAQYDDAWQFPIDWGTAMLCGSGRIEEPPSDLNDKDFRAKRIHVYPNPFKQSITISTLLYEGSDISVEILDIAGKSLYAEYSFCITTGKYITTIDLDQVVSGIYIVKVDAGSLCYITKIIKY